MTDEPTIVAAVVTGPEGILLGRRRDGNPEWTFPSGCQEGAETYAETAVRETLEETGLAVIPHEQIGERIHPKTRRHMVYIAAGPTDGTAVRVCDPDELCEVGWYPWDTAERMLPHLFESVAEYLRSIFQ